MKRQVALSVRVNLVNKLKIMNRNANLYYITILTLGIFLGVIMAFIKNKENDPSQENLIQEEKKRNQELFAMKKQSYDFLTALNQGKIDYMKELVHLSKYAFNYETAEIAKLNLLLKKWGALSPRVALSAVEKLPFQYRYICLHDVAEGWAERNPEELAHYYKENRELLQQKHFLTIAMKSWADTAPESAIKFLSSLEMEEEKVGLKAILDKINTDYPDKYKKIVAILPERQLNNTEFVTGIMDQWIQQDSVSALEWMSSRPEEQQELLAHYKELEGLPAINSLLSLVNDDPVAFTDQAQKYPVWFQAQVWCMALNEITNTQGTMEMILWKEAHVPHEWMKKIDRLESFQFPKEIMNEDIGLYEKVMQQIPSRGTPEDLYYNVLGNYLKNFSPRYPEKVFSFLLDDKKNPLYLPSIQLSHWLYDEPQKAQEWVNALRYYSDKDRELELETREKVKPVMAIKKDNTL